MESRLRVRCRCVWEGVRCLSDATQEDGLCDWCADFGARTVEQLRANPNACIGVDGEYMGLGGAGEFHDAPLVYDADLRIPAGKTAACWYPNSGRRLVEAH